MTIGPSKIIPKKIKEKIKNNPKLRRKIYPIYAKYLRTHLRVLTWWKTSRHYEAKITPFDIIHVKPEEIQYQAENPLEKNKNRNLIPKVIDGDWDKKKKPFEEKPVYKACKAKFIEGKKWEQTQRYKEMKQGIKTGNPVGGVKNQEDLEQYFKNLEKLYEEIKQNGYKKQSQIKNKRKGFRVHRKMVIDRYLGETDEVQINIGRNGGYLFHDGRHRLSIAKLLQIDKIPVRIFIRHKKWQEKRDLEINNSQKIKEIYNHPDINLEKQKLIYSDY